MVRLNLRLLLRLSKTYKRKIRKRNSILKYTLFSNGLDTDTTRTDIFLALNQIVKREHTKNLKNIIMISDGLHHNNNNFHLLENINIPVNPVKPGKPKSSLDLNLEEIKSNNPVYQNIETDLQVRVVGLQKNLPVDLSLWQGENKLLQKSFIAKSKIENWILHYTPRQLGYQKLSFKVSTNEKKIQT